MSLSLRVCVDAVLLLLQGNLCTADEVRPPENPEPLNETLVEYVVLQIDGGNELQLIRGQSHKFTGEFELKDGVASLEFVMVKVFKHSDDGEITMAEALADVTLIEGSRYSFTAELTAHSGQTGEVELRVVTIPPGKRGQVPIYRETVPLEDVTASDAE
jgi:hypothetical protein